MTTASIEEFRERLRRERRAIAETVRRTGDELTTLEPHQPGALAEDAAAQIASGVLSALEGQETSALDEIDAAQARLEAGTYGTCEECHGPIALARLRARPAARYCLACQRRHEH